MPGTVANFAIGKRLPRGERALVDLDVPFFSKEGVTIAVA